MKIIKKSFIIEISLYICKFKKNQKPIELIIGAK